MPAASTCPSCGNPAEGAFCGQCGAVVAARHCAACGAVVAAGTRFCASCGTAVTPGAGSAGRPPYVVAGGVLLGVALLAALFLLARDPSARAAPVAVGPVAPSGAAPPVAAPDISQMSPRERFDRLYNRIMTAQEQGDQATVETFTPMALMAYAQLPEVDADAQYHLALLRLHAGDVAGAQALADSILAGSPTHLFGFLIRSTAAAFGGDAAARAAAEESYRAAWTAEMAAGRPEYEHHRRMLDETATRVGAR